ncbi:helix-turn-helix domain-containing protein [Pseudomonas sp. zfem003]|nr:helix-turn-helix domain-containing protein [Pseudomonas sp. zfem003]MDU9398678.1 helix-turn-helix domain-containing protein [Pseudomonas sp. zfem003]
MNFTDKASSTSRTSSAFPAPCVSSFSRSPQALFGKRCLGRLDGTFKVGAETRLQRLLTRTLCERPQDFFDRLANREAEHFEGDVLELLSSIIAGQRGEHRVSALSASYLLTAKRLIAECRLLSNPQASGLDISEVAYRHGYSSQAHFARSSKARYGRTLSEVRGEGCNPGSGLPGCNPSLWPSARSLLVWE